VYVLANKCDLEVTIPLDKHEEWAADRAYPFFRTSAKDYKSVAVVFEAVAEHVSQAATGHSTTAAAPTPRSGGGGCC
jgi:hypothetical protein